MHFTSLLLAALLAPFLLLPVFADSLPRQGVHARSSNHRRNIPHAHSRRSTPRTRPRSPVSPFQSIPGSGKLPLTRITTRSESNSHLHPQVLLQQHINKGVKRHARMTKREEPSDEHLRARLVRRLDAVAAKEKEMNAVKVKKEKRWRGGEAMAGMGTTIDHIKASLNRVLAGERGDRGRNGAANDNGSTNSTSGNTDTTTSSSNDTVAGFSQVDLDAANQGTVTEAIAPTAVQSIGMAIEANDIGYFATVQIGTPPADFRILMDSGSADFWVPSTACPDCGNHQALGSPVSSSFIPSNNQFQVTYGTGNVQGFIIQDDLSLAGLPLPALSFGVTTVESPEFSDPSVPFDGLMGLAQSSLSNQGVATPIEALAAAGTVASATVGYHLARLSDGVNDGEITFGGVDGSKFSGALTEFTNVNTNGFWEGAIDDVTVNGVSLGLAGRTAILDTGTTLIIAPAADAEAIHAAIPGSASDGQGGFTIPCTTTASVALTFSGTTFAINPSDLTFLPLTDDLQGDCISGISSGQIGGAEQWLVGDVFLKNVYFATDVNSNTMGLAPAIVATA